METKRFMKVILISSVFLMCLAYTGYSQVLTKREIRNEWLKSNNPTTKDSILLRILNKESVYKKDLINTIKELKENNVDTLGLFRFFTLGNTKKTYTGGGGLYLVWQSKDQYYVKRYTNEPVGKKSSLERSYFIDFFKQEYNVIRYDYLLPPIYSGKRVGGAVEYDGQIVMHDKYYTIFCQLGEKFKVIEFGNSYVSDEKSLFYLDNVSAFSYHWFLIAEAEMKRSLLQP